MEIKKFCFKFFREMFESQQEYCNIMLEKKPREISGGTECLIPGENLGKFYRKAP